jgi:hypothetical protein
MKSTISSHRIFSKFVLFLAVKRSQRFDCRFLRVFVFNLHLLFCKQDYFLKYYYILLHLKLLILQCVRDYAEVLDNGTMWFHINHREPMQVVEIYNIANR